MKIILAAMLLLTGAVSAQTPDQRAMLDEIRELRRRIDMLESRISAPAPAPPPAEVVATQAPAPLTDSGATLNLTFDGYYGYNFNNPASRVNLLRAYDVSSNSFSLNQATMVFERAPDVAANRRFGIRVDLQYGQATETLQGSPTNEPRPNVYRPLFQAYGTYVAPIGSGLTVDFGKWSSSLGAENNFTKDQMNYSRSYLFNFLPYYHLGFRAGYDVTKQVNVAYWLVNGAQQSEDFNTNKSQALIVTLKPASNITWNLNYYEGVEPPAKRENIFDTYLTWKAGKKTTIVAEADYVTHHGAHVAAGAAYARYEFTHKFALNARSEYFADRGGLFSGTSQNLKEATITGDWLFADGLLARAEWRGDFSDRAYFDLHRQQNTATLGLVWWFGGKKGPW